MSTKTKSELPVIQHGVQGYFDLFYNIINYFQKRNLIWY